MMPEHDQPFGRRRWDSVAEIELFDGSGGDPSAGGEDVPATPIQADLAD